MRVFGTHACGVCALYRYVTLIKLYLNCYIYFVLFYHRLYILLHTVLSFTVTCSQYQGWQYGTVHRYGMPQFLLRSTLRWYCTFFLKWYGYGRLVRYAFLIKVRGGVTDTRLEAKAKDTKKIRGQGQGQPFRGQTLSRPRTGMLEAKANDQGHKRKCSPKKKKKKKKVLDFSGYLKKKSSQKFFKRSPQKNVFQKIFQALHKILTIQKIVLSSSRGQANFRGLEASRPRPRT